VLARAVPIAGHIDRVVRIDKIIKLAPTVLKRPQRHQGVKGLVWRTRQRRMSAALRPTSCTPKTR